MIIEHRAVFGLNGRGLARLGREGKYSHSMESLAGVIKRLEGTVDLSLSRSLVVEHLTGRSEGGLECLPRIGRVILGAQLVSLVDGLLQVGFVDGGLLERDVELV